MNGYPMNFKTDETAGNINKMNLESTASSLSSIRRFQSPPYSSTKKRKWRSRLRRQFLFDHLWGIAGGVSQQDYNLLRSIHHRQEKLNIDEQETYPYIILDELDIAENRDHCCNNAFGRTCREYAWHTAAHGLKYTVFQAKRKVDRILWALIIIVAFILAIWVSVSAWTFLSKDSLYLSIESVGLGDDEVELPAILVCPPKPWKLDENKRQEIEALLPPIAEMWDLWNATVNGHFNPDLDLRSGLPWASDPNQEVHNLMEQIMIEAGILSISSSDECSQFFRECSTTTYLSTSLNFGCCPLGMKTVLTDEGLCYKLDVSGGKEREETKRHSTIDSDDERNMGYFLSKAKPFLNFSIQLSGTTSTRVGYPIVTAEYFGSGYLCGHSWGSNEAKVICKGLGFSGGTRYEMERAQTFPSTNLLGMNISCTGDERSILECTSSYRDITGITLSQCQETKPSAILCDEGSLHLGRNRITKTRGLPYVEFIDTNGNVKKSYICAKDFTDTDADVFCKMLSWPQGRAVSITGGNANSSENLGIPTLINDLNCKQEDPHILDCDHVMTHDQSCGEPAAVECGPGFPMTLRMYDYLSIANKLSSDKVSIGYPIIDTPGKPGYICDDKNQIDSETSRTLCQNLGFMTGAKIPAGIYGGVQTDNNGGIFVLDHLQCQGNELSVFSCDLGAWGDYECGENGDILSLVCVEDEKNAKFDHVMVANSSYMEVAGNERFGIAGISTAFGFIPICHDETQKSWTDREANVICQDRNFECGMIDRRNGNQYIVPLHERLMVGVFASVKCPNAGLGMASNCRTFLRTTCESTKAATVHCVNSEHEDFGLCKLLQLQETSSTDEKPSITQQEVVSIALHRREEEQQQQGCDQGADDAGTIRLGSFYTQSLDSDNLDIKLTATKVDSSSYVVDRWKEESRGCKEDQIYEQDNCWKACQATLALSACQCLPWFLSRTKFEVDYPICQGQGNICAKKLAKALKIVLKNVTYAERNLLLQGITLANYDYRDQCGQCLPKCNGHVAFQVEEVKTQTQRGNCSANLSRIKIHFDRQNSRRLLRRVTHIWEIGLGLMGGIFSLFSGFGLICILEILYFLLVRWLVDNRNDPIIKRKQREREQAEVEAMWRNSGAGSHNNLRRTLSDTDLVAEPITAWEESIFEEKAPQTASSSAKKRPRTISSGASSSRTRKSNSAVSVKSNGSTRRRSSGSSTSNRSRTTSGKSRYASASESGLRKDVGQEEVIVEEEALN